VKAELRGCCFRFNLDEIRHTDGATRQLVRQRTLVVDVADHGNVALNAVLRRNGFAKEGLSRRYLKINGRWRDHERWAILKEDWLAKR